MEKFFHESNLFLIIQFWAKFHVSLLTDLEKKGNCIVPATKISPQDFPLEENDQTSLELFHAGFFNSTENSLTSTGRNIIIILFWQTENILSLNR